MIKTLRQLMMVLFFATAFSGLAIAAPATNSAAQPLDNIVAVVNSEVITQSQLDKQMAIVKQGLQSANTPLPSDVQLRPQVLDQLIYKSLQMQLAQRTHLTVTDAQLNDAINKIAQRNNLTMAQLKDEVAKQGMNYDDFRKQIHDQMLVSQLQQRAIGASAAVSDQEISDFMRGHTGQQGSAQYHVADILIPLPATPTAGQIDDAQKRAQDIVQRLQKGANFQEIAAGQSAGEQALQGGDLGWRNLADLPSIFAERVTSMKAGDIAGPIRAPNGFHIIKVVEVKNSAQQLTKDQVRQLIFQRKMEENLSPWLQQLRASAYVKVM